MPLLKCISDTDLKNEVNRLVSFAKGVKKAVDIE